MPGDSCAPPARPRIRQPTDDQPRRAPPSIARARPVRRSRGSGRRTLAAPQRASSVQRQLRVERIERAEDRGAMGSRADAGLEHREARGKEVCERSREAVARAIRAAAFGTPLRRGKALGATVRVDHASRRPFREHERRRALRGWRRPDQAWEWQRRAFHHRMRDRIEYEEKLAYVRENPWRKNLVMNPDDGPFQGRVHDVQWIGN